MSYRKSHKKSRKSHRRSYRKSHRRSHRKHAKKHVTFFFGQGYTTDKNGRIQKFKSYPRSILKGAVGLGLKISNSKKLKDIHDNLVRKQVTGQYHTNIFAEDAMRKRNLKKSQLEHDFDLL
jgi:hypothetical protein